MSLEQELRDGAAWCIQLADDLKSGKAVEVPASAHVFRHPVFPKELEIGPVQDGQVPKSVDVVYCVDFLKLWGVYVYIATCPRTGTRFVEGTGK